MYHTTIELHPLIQCHPYRIGLIGKICNDQQYGQLVMKNSIFGGILSLRGHLDILSNTCDPVVQTQKEKQRSANPTPTFRQKNKIKKRKEKKKIINKCRWEEDRQFTIPTIMGDR
jgi:hypothetical protein